jgi:PBP1b-binding outer membrane lipoprotein LpoB
MKSTISLLVTLLLAGCASTSVGDSGRAPTEVGIGARGPVQGVGIGGRDIASMTNQMARDILSTKAVVGEGGAPPRVIIDAQYFKIEGSQPINRNLISQRLLVELNRAAAGRLVFVGRRHAGMVAEERELKREGVTDTGSRRLAKAQLGADYRLAGTFTTLDQAQARTGLQQRYNQLVFELVDVENGEIVWTGMYEVERAGADDIVYR